MDKYEKEIDWLLIKIWIFWLKHKKAIEGKEKKEQRTQTGSDKQKKNYKEKSKWMDRNNHSKKTRSVMARMARQTTQDWRLRQEKVKNICSFFWLVALEPMNSASKYILYCLCIHMAINNHGCIVLIWIQCSPWWWRFDVLKMDGWFESSGQDPDYLHRKTKNESCHEVS